jgi:iron complex transport system permease protein
MHPTQNSITERGNTAPAILFPRWRGRIYAIAILAGVLVAVAAFAASVGSVDIPLGTTLAILVSKLPFVNIEPNWTDSFETIVVDIRLPRVILAGVVGAALAVAGAAYQALGAALGAVIGFLLPIGVTGLGYGVVPVLAFIGALLSIFIVYNIARVGRLLPVTTLILAGVALSALLMAIVSYLLTIAGDKVHGIIFWLIGSFSLSQWNEVAVALPVVLFGVGIIMVYARSLNLIQLGEEQAQQLGINTERMKLILLAAATLVTAAAVSFVGIIGFVGIIIPHAVRLIWGPDHRFLLPLSILVGAIFLILADIIARTINAPTEVPIGVITALTGVPFFLYLLRRRTKILN